MSQRQLILVAENRLFREGLKQTLGVTLSVEPPRWLVWRIILIIGGSTIVAIFYGVAHLLPWLWRFALS